MPRHRERFAFVAAGVAIALTIAGAAVAALAGHAAAGTTTIKVTEREYHISLSTTSVSAGTITFSIHNAGKLTHNFNVSGGGGTAAHVIGIKPGTTRTLKAKFSGGTVRVWCSVPGHAALGMKTSLKVKAAAGASTGATGGTTTGGGNAWG
jgi:uncharacterized cupredoxin-like copper-binding protein